MAHWSVSSSAPLPAVVCLSIISVALLTAALGGALPNGRAGRAPTVAGPLPTLRQRIIAWPPGERGPAGFGIANQVTVLRAGLVGLVAGALMAARRRCWAESAAGVAVSSASMPSMAGCAPLGGARVSAHASTSRSTRC
jgi:hypothetical protein